MAKNKRLHYHPKKQQRFLNNDDDKTFFYGMTFWTRGAWQARTDTGKMSMLDIIDAIRST